MEDRLEDVLIERRDAIVWITLNRPAKANAMTVDVMNRMAATISKGASEPQVKAIVLTGAGDRVFCAGVDVREQSTDGDEVAHRERRSCALAALQDSILDSSTPVISALNGIASGGGAMLALLSDACVAVDTAALSLPEIDLGIATFSGANILEVIGGRALALDLIQTGRRMSADECVKRGVVRAMVQPSDLASAAMNAAQTLGAKNGRTFAQNKAWINRSLVRALSEARAEHARHRSDAVSRAGENAAA